MELVVFECNMVAMNPPVLLNKCSICRYVLINLHVPIDLTFHIYIKFKKCLGFLDTIKG